jgi:DNA ligase-1
VRGSNAVTLLADVVAASQEVAATSSRSRKVAILAGLLQRLERSEVAVAAGLLSGAPRQGRVGVGYSTIYGIESAPADEPTLMVADVDTAMSQIQATTGSGSGARRRQLLAELLNRATEPEAGFVRRLFTGELRQGALAGVMVDAVARAAGVPAELARRALMLSGDLTRTAEIAMSDGEERLRAVGFELFRPIFPMLASTAESVADAVSGADRASVSGSSDGIASRSTDAARRCVSTRATSTTSATPCRGSSRRSSDSTWSRPCSTARRSGWPTLARPPFRTRWRSSTPTRRPRG